MGILMDFQIIVRDLPNDKVTTHIYDAIFMCNGHTTTPSWPDIPGMEKFRGVSIHSHDYRKPEAYKGKSSGIKILITLISFKSLILDKDVLIIGAGPSGVDLTYAVSKHAKRLAFSHRTHNPNHRLPNTVSFKGQIREITESGAVFTDGSQETFTHIIYCTGEQFYGKYDLF